VSGDDDSAWTRVDVKRAGVVRVRARLSAAGALRREPRCADIQVNDATAISPPVGSR
jgi:hypothetical protein